MLDSSGAILAARNEKRVFYAASTIKLGVAIAVLRAVDRGDLSLTAEVPSRHQFESRMQEAPPFEFVPGEIDEGFPPAGSPVTLATCLERMITVSSNEGTNILTELVGLDAVTNAFASLGATTARMTRLIGDYSAREAGYTHEASALDLATTMQAICSGNACSQDSTSLLLDHLRAQTYPVITAVVPANTDSGSKSGWVTDIEHDVAFIGTPGDPTSAMLAVCTEGLAPGPAHESIRGVAAALMRSPRTPPEP
nr:serine hydrolase [Lysinibacter cavernae]